MNTRRKLVVAIDGPAGAGKSTVADAVARRLGLGRLDTGSMYRAVTWAAMDRGLDLDDAEAVASLAASLRIDPAPDGLRIDGELREKEIRDPTVTESVSRVSRHPQVRAVMVAAQQRLAKQGGVVIEGRDIGSVVAPDADVKIFLTADPVERARRRGSDLEAAGHSVHLEDLRREIERRDAIDDQTTPLRAAKDAVVIDSTGRSAGHVAEEIAAIAESKAKDRQ